MPKEVNIQKKPGFGCEYNSIRSEILKRIEMRQQLISITLTLAGIFISFGLTNELVPLIYPPLAMFLAFGWAQNDFRIRRLARYVRDELESLDIGLHYESAMDEDRKLDKGLVSWRFVVISHSGIFLFTQILAIGIDLLRHNFQFDTLRIVLLCVDTIAIIFVAWITWKSTR